MTAILALSAALIAGAADFGGGLASRTAPAVRVALVVQVFSFVTVLVGVWLIAAPQVRTADLVAGGVAGAAAAAAFVALYASLARGKISLLAPIAAIVGAIVPTGVATLGGDELSLLQVVGILVACVAIVLVAQEPVDPTDPHRVRGSRLTLVRGSRLTFTRVRGSRLAFTRTGGGTPPEAIALAVLSGVGFSVFFLALAETDVDAGLWPLVSARVVSVPLMFVVAMLATSGIRLEGHPLRLSVAVGLSDGISSALVLWAFQRGPIAVAAVLSAFYPISTVALARIVLKERLQSVQWLGVVLALAAIPLIA